MSAVCRTADFCWDKVVLATIADVDRWCFRHGGSALSNNCGSMKGGPERLTGARTPLQVVGHNLKETREEDRCNRMEIMQSTHGRWCDVHLTTCIVYLARFCASACILHVHCTLPCATTDMRLQNLICISVHKFQIRYQPRLERCVNLSRVLSYYSRIQLKRS
jgi:hypothetical protein